jgi:hypothetical protein
MISKKISTMLSHDPLVVVKCILTPGVLGQPGLNVWVGVGGVVVGHDVQFATRAGLGDELAEGQELGVGVSLVAGVGDLAGGELQAANELTSGGPRRRR